MASSGAEESVIAFLTFFLGIAFGVHTVELSAGPGVARVELRVDGVRAAEIGPPWKATLDLGGEVAPRELVAIAYDAGGNVLGEARQWINRATSDAEAGLSLERDASGRVVAARLSWRCPVSPEPASISVSFDGQPLEVRDPARIPLPPHAAGSAHLLVADLAFAEGIAATAVASFGGKAADEAQRELSAVPVRLAAGARLPDAAAMEGWFEAGGKALPVAAVEEGPAEVVFVSAGRARLDLEGLAASRSAPWPRPWTRPLDPARESRLRFLSATPRLVQAKGSLTRVFPSSREEVPAVRAFLRLGQDAFRDEGEAPQRIAEAVATAALAATRRERRRAVVLLLGADARETGDLDAARARRYLARLRVPLHVWRVSPQRSAAGADWPGAVDASTIAGLGRAFETLRSDLASQRVVWVEGRIAPSAVTVAPRAAGVVAAR